MTKKIKKLMLNGQEYEIREYQEWGGWRQPWANTVAYYPLTADTNDYSWNSRNLTNSWVIFTGWVWNFDGSSYANRSWTEQLNTWYTISFIAKSSVNNTAFIFDMRNNNEYWQGVYLVTENWNFKVRQQKASNDEEEYSRARDWNENHWAITWTWNVWTVYFNWTQVKQATINNSINTSNTNLALWARYSLNSWYYTWTIREFIVEDKVWSTQEVSDYYNTIESLEPLEPQTEPCTVCEGTGEVECDICGWTWQEMCPTCSWMWQIWDPEDPESRTECPECNGWGFISCWICDWTWMVTCSNCGWTWEEPLA